MGCTESREEIPTSNKGLVFRVRVLQALKLRTSLEVQVGQSNASRLQSTRDPYVKLSCTGTSSVQHTSTVVHDSESPTWNEEFFFCVDTETPELTVTVMDKEAIKGDLEVGQAKVNLHGLISFAEPRVMWLPLVDRHLQSAVPVVAGEIGISVVGCYRLSVRVNAANIPVLDSLLFWGNSAVVRHGRQERLTTETAEAAPKAQHTFTADIQKTFYVPYGEPSQLHVSGWSLRRVGSEKTGFCHGWHNVHLRGIPRTHVGAPSVPFQLTLPLHASTEQDLDAPMSVTITLQEFLGYENVVPAPPVTDEIRALWPPDRPVTRFFDCHVLNATNVMAMQPNAEDPTLADAIKERVRNASGKIGVYARLEYMRDVLDTAHVKSQTQPEWNETFTFYSLPVVGAKGWEPTLPEFRMSVWDHGLHNHDCLGAAFTKLEDLRAGGQLAKTYPLERGGELNVVFRTHFDIIVRILEVEVFTAKDLNGLSDTFVELNMAGKEYRTRVKFEDRAPMYRDEFRFSMSTGDVLRPESMNLRLGVYDMDVPLFSTKGVTTDIVGLAELDVSSALKSPRTPVEFTCAVGVGNVMDGRVRLEVVSEFLSSHRDVIIHEARYGFVDAGPQGAFTALFDSPTQVGHESRWRTANDAPATWRHVTELVRSILLDNKLNITPKGDATYLRKTFWPEAPNPVRPNQRRGLSVRYSIGAGNSRIETLFDEPKAADGENVSIDIEAPADPEMLISLHESVVDSAEARAQAAEKAAAQIEADLQRLSDERAAVERGLAEAREANSKVVRAAAETDAEAAKREQAMKDREDAAKLRLATIEEEAEKAKQAAAETKLRTMLAKADAAAAAKDTADAAREKAAAEANEAERLQRLREQFEAEVRAADESRARRAEEERQHEEARSRRIRESADLERQIAAMRAEASGRDKLLADKKKLEEEMKASDAKRHEFEEQQRQAKLLQERIERLKMQEAESSKKAKAAQDQSERLQKEAAVKSALAQRMASTRVTPSYWSADADDHQGFRKIDLSSEQVWRDRFQNLLDDTCRRNTLGAGRDQIIKSGKYDRLLFHRAWRIENAQLYALYAAHRDNQIGTPNERAVAKTHQVSSSKWIEEMGLRDKERNELLLWHGTKPDVVDLIAKDGFDERLCSLAGLFGAGVYFADEVSKSDQYVTPTPPNDPKNGVYHILLVRVTMGNFANLTTGTKDARRAPAGCHAIIGQIDKNKYREFVTYDGWLAYPEYVLQYKRQYH